ncbi:MAG TPA: ATP-grasp domain-containing protein [Pseudoduganella sp.]
MAPLTAIRAEYRIFVIGGELAAASRYKLGERVESSLQVPAEVLAFAERAVEQWRPNDAFTIDIAETDTGLKVIELNSANSAGFYACNVGQIIDAVNQRLVC